VDLTSLISLWCLLCLGLCSLRRTFSDTF
jgi:hypothetical protein